MSMMIDDERFLEFIAIDGHGSEYLFKVISMLQVCQDNMLVYKPE